MTSRYASCVSVSCVNNGCLPPLKLSQACLSLPQSTCRDKRPSYIAQVSTLCFEIRLVTTFIEEKRIYKRYSYSPAKLTLCSSFTNAGTVLEVEILKIILFCSCQRLFLEIGNAKESQVLCPKSSGFFGIERSRKLLIL